MPYCHILACQADEVTVAKHPDETDHTKIKWDGFLGLMERNNPKSLIIERLPVRRTKRRAPGPGALRIKDWKPLGNKWVVQPPEPTSKYFKV